MTDSIQNKSKTVLPDDLHRTIERAKRELEHMIDLNPQIMLLVDNNGIVVRANLSLLRILGLSKFDEVVGRKIDELFHCKDPKCFSRLLGSKAGHDVYETEASLSDQQCHCQRRHLGR